MNRRIDRVLVLLVLGLISIGPSAIPAFCQEKSVRPGINKSFQNPSVNKFVERFEREGREVFDKRKRIVAACKIKPGMVIADIGAGTGLFTRMLAPLVGTKGRVYAVDIAKNFVDHVKQTCKRQGLKNVTGVVCSQSSVNLPPNSIDLAFVCDTYHHFEFPYKTMRSIYRALRPGGKVVLVEFHRIEGVSSEWILNHVRADQETFTKEILISGFKVTEEPKFLKTSYCLRFQKTDRKTATGHTQDSLDAVRELLADKTAMLIDVRERDEWDAGHLKAAELLPLSTLRTGAARQNLAAKLAKGLPKDKIIYCHCRSGGRVLVATKILEKLNYDVRPLKAGYFDLIKSGFAKAK